MPQNGKRDRRELLVSLDARPEAASFCLAASNRMKADLSTNLGPNSRLFLEVSGYPD
jgi:hypothetical protein